MPFSRNAPKMQLIPSMDSISAISMLDGGSVSLLSLDDLNPYGGEHCAEICERVRERSFQTSLAYWEETGRQGPRPRLLSQEVISDETNITYDKFVQGRIDPPARWRLLRFCEVVDATSYEREQILLSAGYIPPAPSLDDETANWLLTEARRRIHEEIGYPAVVVRRDWTIAEWNRAFDHLHGARLAQLSADHRHLLVVAIMGRRAEDMALIARRTDPAGEQGNGLYRMIHGFREETKFCRDEPWFRETLQRLMTYPEFAENWRELQLGTGHRPELMSSKVELQHSEMGSLIMRPDHILMDGTVSYPRLIMYVPLDEATRTAYKLAGFKQTLIA